MQTTFRQIPKTAPAAVPKEPAEETALPRRKFNPWQLFIVLIFTGLVLAYFLTDGKSQKDYFDELSARKEAGEALASGEQKDYCELLFLLRDSISLECVGVLDGINWDNPPKTPEGLGEDWEELPTNFPLKNRFFRHKKYRLKIRFDYADETVGRKAAKSRDHWHRENPNSQSKLDIYLDKNGKPVALRNKNNHIYTRK